MRHLTHIQKRASKMKFIFILMMVAFVYPKAMVAQKLPIKTNPSPEKVEIPPSSIELDSLEQTTPPKGILKKIIQPFKFRENRNRKERARIYSFMKEMIDSSQLRIDSTTVDEIMKQLESVYLNNNARDENYAAFGKQIDAIIAEYNIDKQASKDIIDSLKIQVETIIKKESAPEKIETDSIADLVMQTTETFLNEVRFITSNCTNKDEQFFTKNDSLQGFKSCLNLKKKVIGWHNSWNKTEYKNYNYKYLSALNLYGYELSANGSIKNQKDLEEFQKPGGVIEFAQNKGTDVHITIYNKAASEISRFLNDPDAQYTFFGELESLITYNDLKGVNIFFEHIRIRDEENFVEFIRELKQLLVTKDTSIALHISIPAVWEHNSLKYISAYNFTKLNTMVDYYMVMTDRMTSLKSKLALTPSPLYKSDQYGQQTISSTINFYRNGKIPVSKLIMSVSYLGIDWQVDDFSGTVVQGTKGKELKYNEIIQKYNNSPDPKSTVIKGFDTIQVATYLEFTKSSRWGGKPKYRKIWYEDNQSLYLKYQWMLDNKLGGVAIRGLGYDDGYSDLWDILGATLTKIDTIYVDGHKNTLNKGTEICTFNAEKDSFNIFNKKSRDTVWNNFQPFRATKDTLGYWEKFIEDNYWAIQPVLRYRVNNSVPDVILDNEDVQIKLLHNEHMCHCLMGRWYFYSKVLFLAALLCIGILIILKISVYQMDKYNLENKKTRLLIRIAIPALFILSMFIFLIGIYLSPEVPFIGASNTGSTGFQILIATAILGLVIGIMIYRELIRGRYVSKNLP